MRQVVEAVLEEVGMAGNRPRNMAVDEFLMYVTINRL